MSAPVHQRPAPRGHPPVRLSPGIDCLDPAFAPGTGTPESGSLSGDQVLPLLEELADLPFVGIGCVEVAPAGDHGEPTRMAAANFFVTNLAARVAARGSRLRVR